MSALFIVFLLSLQSNAVSFTVKKTKGNQAIIESSSELEDGKTYQIGEADFTMDDSTKVNERSRYNSISFGANMQFLSGSNYQDNAFAIAGRYGWNHQVFEFGPEFKINGEDKGFGYTINYAFGAYFDYNFIPNKYPTQMHYGFTTAIDIGSTQLAAGGNTPVYQFFAGGFLTWYVNNTPVAIRTELDYSVKKITSSQSDTTIGGFIGQMYLQYYF